MPDTAIDDADRYRGTEDDERRLFYVAVTRAQKYLYLSFSRADRRETVRLRLHAGGRCGLVRFDCRQRAAVGPRATRAGAKGRAPRVTLSFSELKYLFECSYQFKLRFMYGFNAPPRGARFRQGTSRRTCRDAQASVGWRFGDEGRRRRSSEPAPAHALCLPPYVRRLCRQHETL
ncbi:3'-5' exonuclease [Pengzhenrongella phosphoraccumulans]|uniref:3'-5' exonuclease n=1 Tax=Pengzhenrongella phosphoraccumulans TaxID=3114394 RepID=UPI00388EAC5B